MLTATPSGLRHTPFTKYLLGSVLVSSTVASILDVKHLLHLQLHPHILGQGQYWRLLVWQCCYVNAGEVLFGAVALYNLRVLERLMGTRRFASCVAVCFSLTSLATPLALFLLRASLSTRFNVLSGGMTATLFALLFQFKACVPSSYTIHPTGNTGAGPGLGLSPTFLSDKFFLYAIGLQLATAQSPGSLVAAATGWIVGAVYQGTGLSQFRLPCGLTDWLSGPPSTTTVRAATTGVQTFRPRDAARHAAPAVAGQDEDASAMAGAGTGTGPQGSSARHVAEALGAFAGAATGTAGSQPRELRPASQQDVETLMSMMGISRLEAVQALGLAGNSLERAVEHLLQG